MARHIAVSRPAPALRRRRDLDHGVPPAAAPAALLPAEERAAEESADACGLACECDECGSRSGRRVVARSILDTVGQAISGAVGAVVDAVGDVLDIRECEEEKDALEDKEDFLDGSYGPEDLRPPTGLGGFGAAYDPRAEVFTISLRGGVTFTDGLSIDAAGNVTAAAGAHPNAGAAATQIMSLPVEQRAAAVAPWQWGGDKATWLAGFESAIESAWGAQHEFHCTRRYWEDIGAQVEVEVTVHEGAKADDEHMSLTVFKVPDAFVGGVGVVSSGGGGALDNRMTLNSNDIMARRDNLLVPQAITFAPGSTALGAAAGQVSVIAATYAAGLTPSCSYCGKNIEGTSGPVLTITCQGDGPDRDASARARFDAITAALTAAGFTDTDARTVFVADTAADGQTCRVVADNGAAQIVAAHEAGHMFGLGDEYAVGAGSMITGTGRTAGQATRHDQLVRDMGLQGSVAENNDNIMSVGNVVRPQHYATFLWALREVTGMQEWALGPAGIATLPTCSLGPGDFPVPSPDGPQYA